MKPRLLDLFSGAGGSARGYQLAGFHVTGVDINPQPNYCGDEFHQADALWFLERTTPADEFDVIHASPPCQDHSTLRHVAGEHGTGHLLAGVLLELRGRFNGRPWIVENVESADFGPTVSSVTLCGSSFGLRVRRHRTFASNVVLLGLPCDHGTQGQPVGVYGTGGGGQMTRGYKARGITEASHAMGISWMTRAEIAQAIPPDYTEFLGAQLLEHLRERAA